MDVVAEDEEDELVIEAVGPIEGLINPGGALELLVALGWAMYF